MKRVRYPHIDACPHISADNQPLTDCNPLRCPQRNIVFWAFVNEPGFLVKMIGPRMSKFLFYTLTEMFPLIPSLWANNEPYFLVENRHLLNHFGFTNGFPWTFRNSISLVLEYEEAFVVELWMAFSKNSSEIFECQNS